jgi:alpha-glucosidase
MPAAEFLWWQQEVIYEIYLRSFRDTTGNGMGDLNGIIEKLDYLNDERSISAAEAKGDHRSLGSRSLTIDAIWLTPFYPSPMADFGYDVADYADVDPIFGDLATFDLLLKEAHRRGIKVIIDFVPNHSSDQHQWFIESRSSKDNPKRDWYIWRDAQPDGSLPNNWGSPFGGPTWTWDENTGQYYFHHFLPEQPELNWRNPDLRTAMFDVLRFWLDRGVDGFRMDVIGMIIKDQQFRDNPINPKADPDLHPDNIFGRQLHVYNEDQDEVHGVLREIRQVLDEYDERCVLGELGYTLERWVKYYGQYGDGLHLPINFRLMERAWNAASIRRLVEELEAILPNFAWPTYVLGSHDAPRPATRLGSDQARIAAMLLLTLRGTPILYCGDELGMENVTIPLDRIQDPQGIRLGPENGRDGARTPMQWDGGPHAGFSTTAPWLPTAENYVTCNVAEQSEDPGSLFNLYRRLIQLRRESPALMIGSYRSVEAGPEDCFCYFRDHPDQECLVALNFTDKDRALSISSGRTGTIRLSTYLDREDPVSLDRLDLRGNEGVMIEVNR